MQLSIEIPDHVAAALQARGVSPDRLISQILEDILAFTAETQEPPGDDEWMRKFRTWVSSHPTNTPLLSGEAISRESIYRERGL